MSNAIEQYYQGQASGLPYFVGPATQRGHGLGGIFSSIFRAVAPVLKGAAPILKTAARGAANEAIRTGGEILSDIAKGESASKAAKLHGQQAADRLLKKGASRLRRMIDTSPKSIKGNRKRRKKDIFSR